MWWTHLSSAITGIMIAWAMLQRYIPYQLRWYVEKYSQKWMGFVYPYIQITFPEFSGERMKRSEAFSAIQNYLSANSTSQARKLKADAVKDNSKSIILSMDDYEEVTDDFNGIMVWWAAGKTIPMTQSFSFSRAADERRFFTLTFHKKHRETITGTYIDHVLKEGKAIAGRNRQRKLHTNNPSKDWDGWKSTKWNHIVFEHPASFDTLAMATKKKEEIKNDLIKFSKGKDYYARIGKPWKRGYLLYGPPGTGKSTMISAMANFLNYDIYDLELTTVEDNSELRRLLIETTSKSILVIEDIDCSLDLTGQRKKKKEDENEEKDPVSKMKKEKESKGSKVTLSGLLNFIDGIWSACGGERIIVFTTNHVDKLDPALIRRGRMDKHIEMSYCCFEAFKLLARNYLDIDSHELFPKIRNLLEENNMTPADVAENLMPKSDEEDEETCLKNLIEAIEAAKEEARKKLEEEAKSKAEQEAKLKAEEEAKLKAEQEKKEKDKAPAKDVKVYDAIEAASEEAESEEEQEAELEAEEEAKLKAEKEEEEEDNTPAKDVNGNSEVKENSVVSGDIS